MTNNIVARIEARLAENKSSVRTYASPQMAQGRGHVLSQKAATYFLGDDSGFEGPDYVLVYLPSVKRYTIVFLLSSFITRHNTGGYLGIFADENFFTA